MPLLAGWNADELATMDTFRTIAPTVKNFIERAHRGFGDKAEAFLKVYPAATDEEAKQSAQDFSGDQFIAYSTWKWIELQGSTGKLTSVSI